MNNARPWLMLAIFLFGVLIFTIFIYTPNQQQRNVDDPSSKQERPSKIFVQSHTQGTGAEQDEDKLETNNQFRLFGFYIGQMREAMIELAGNPVNEYFTEGEEEPLFVLEFNDFTAGFNSMDEAEFIIVTTPGIDVGLGAIAIGSSTDDVLASLGSPTSQNDYVMSYERNDETLKFDIDPSSQTINSIKLLRNR